MSGALPYPKTEDFRKVLESIIATMEKIVALERRVAELEARSAAGDDDDRKASCPDEVIRTSSGTPPSSWFSESVCRAFKNGVSFAEIDRTMIEKRDAEIRREIIEEAKRRIVKLARDRKTEEDVCGTIPITWLMDKEVLAALDAMMKEKPDYGTGEPDRLDGAGEVVLDDDIPDLEDNPR